MGLFSPRLLDVSSLLVLLMVLLMVLILWWSRTATQSGPHPRSSNDFRAVHDTIALDAVFRMS